jgi:hypothetical protein
MQIKELERLNNIVQDRENTEGTRSKEIRKLREEIEGLSKALGRYAYVSICQHTSVYVSIRLLQHTSAYVCCKVLSKTRGRYAHVCSRMLTYAHACSRMLTQAEGLSVRVFLTHADVC